MRKFQNSIAKEIFRINKSWNLIYVIHSEMIFTFLLCIIFFVA